MKRFRFELDTALAWRLQRTAREQARLEELVARHRDNEARSADLDRNWCESERSLLAGGAMDGSDLAALDGYSRAVSGAKIRLAAECAKLKDAIERQQRVLLEETRQVRLLEKLKQRRLNEWRRQADIEMENEAADLYLAKWIAREE